MTPKEKENARDTFSVLPYEDQKKVLSTLYDWIKNDFETLRDIQDKLREGK